MNKPMTDHRLHAALAYAGTLPFMACALLSLFNVVSLAGLTNWAAIAAGYAVAIGSFMAGILWGLGLHGADAQRTRLIILSNAITVIIWLTYLLTSSKVSLTTSAAAFIALLLVDYELARDSTISSVYLRLRRNVTVVVVTAIIVTVVS